MICYGPAEQRATQSFILTESCLTYRYRAAIEACCLDVDLAALSDGDSTLIGDRGVTLSGGQRQRVSLARAVYSDRDVYLLDDPLAAVDPDVALTVFRRVVLDFLNDKTVLLVTHHLQVVTTVTTSCTDSDAFRNV